MYKNKSLSALATSLMLGCYVLISGCTVGPDFKKPTPPESSNNYTRETVLTDGSSQVVDVNQAIPKDWWTLFESAELNQFVKEALNNNPSVQVAQTSLRVAKENTLAQFASFFPNAQVGYSKSRQQDPVGTVAPTMANNAPIYSLNSSSLNVGFVPDVFGLNRRTVEALKAQETIQRNQITATYLTLAANTASSLIQEASLQDQIKETRKLIEINQNALSLIKKQADSGGANGLDISTQESLLSQLEQALPPLQKQLEIYRDQLAVLTGNAPSQKKFTDLSLSQFSLPQTLPNKIPSKLVEQRPDVKAAEAYVHASSAQVGIALANRLPQFSITAAFGGVANGFGQMFDKGNRFWGLEGGVSQNIFDFGALKHKQRAAEAALDQSSALYRQTVLTAFQNVADTLYSLDSDQKAINAALNSEAVAQKTLTIVQSQLDAGDVNIFAIWTAQTAYHQAKINVVQAKAQQYIDTVALFQSLGGSWNNEL